MGGRRWLPSLIRGRSFIGNIGVFACTAGLGALSNVVVMMLALHFQGAAAFGHWSLIESVILLTAPLLFGGAHIGLQRVAATSSGHADLPSDQVALDRLVVISTLLSGIAAAVGWSAALLWLIIGAMVLMEAALIAASFHARGRGSVADYALILGTKAVLFPVAYLALMLMHQADDTRHAVLAAYAIGQAVAAAKPVVQGIRRWVQGAAPGVAQILRVYRTAILFGFPLMLVSCVASLGVLLERSIVSSVSSLSELGVYAAHTKIAGIVAMLIVAPVNLWWATACFRHGSDADRGVAFFERAAPPVIWGFGIVTALVCLAIPVVGPYILPGVELRTEIAVLAALSVMFTGIANSAVNYALYQGDGRWLLLGGSVARLAFAGLLGWVATVQYGIHGMALAQVAASLLFMGYIWFMSSRRLSVRLGPAPWVVIVAGVMFIAYDLMSLTR